MSVSPPIPTRLLDLLANRKVVLFVGSGLSVASNIPLWTTAAADLVKEAEASGVISPAEATEMATWDPREVGTYLLSKLAQTDKARFFRKYFWPEQLNTSHTILAQIGFPHVITTNWDCLLERMNQELLDGHDPQHPWQNSRMASFTWMDRHQLDAARKDELTSWVFHLHGLYYRPDTVIWAEDDYDKVLDDSYVQDFLRSTLRDRVVLYVGFSLRDEDFDRVMRGISKTSPEANERHYAILPSVGQAQKRRLAEDRNVSVISYDLDPALPGDQQHSVGLARTLAAIASRLNPSHPSARFRWGRAGNRIRKRFAELLASPADGLGRQLGVNVYASAGRDFLREQNDYLITACKQGIPVRMLLLDPRVEVQRPGDPEPINLHDWRANLGTTKPRLSSSEFAEFIEGQELIEQINKLLALEGVHHGIEFRLSDVFPRGTVCHIGESIFDCPRPIRELSIQGPMFEYRVGTAEFDYYHQTVKALWQTGQPARAVDLASLRGPR